MSMIHIVGSLQEIAEKMRAISEVIEEKKNTGYPIWSRYERWQYVTMRDINVCPVCEQHDRQIYTGDMIKQIFPEAEYIGWYVALPHTHKTQEARSKGMRGECRCQMYLLNAAEAFEAQLHEDKKAVV